MHVYANVCSIFVYVILVVLILRKDIYVIPLHVIKKNVIHIS